jgi:regulator of protease activity HflC (stomatin/prohibitin superfamily)
VLLAAEAERQQQILRAQGIAASTTVLAERLKDNPEAIKAVEVLFALGYLDMGTAIGKSSSSKVMFIDPRSIPAAFEGVKAVIGNMDNGEPQV